MAERLMMKAVAPLFRYEFEKISIWQCGACYPKDSKVQNKNLHTCGDRPEGVTAGMILQTGTRLIDNWTSIFQSMTYHLQNPDEETREICTHIGLMEILCYFSANNVLATICSSPFLLRQLHEMGKELEIVTFQTPTNSQPVWAYRWKPSPIKVISYFRKRLRDNEKTQYCNNNKDPRIAPWGYSNISGRKNWAYTRNFTVDSSFRILSAAVKDAP